MNTHKRPEDEFEKHDSTEGGVFDTENARDRKFVESEPETSSQNQASLESEQSEEYLEDTDQFYQSALMDTYNG